MTNEINDVNFKDYLKLPIMKIFIFGVCFCFFCVFLATFTNDTRSNWGYCKTQMQYQELNLRNASVELADAAYRKIQLSNNLVSQNSQLKTGLRNEIKIENDYIEYYKDKITGFSVQNWKNVIGKDLVLYLLPFIFVFAVAYWMLKDFYWVLDGQNMTIRHWVIPYLSVTTLLFLSNLIQSMITSIWYLEDKAWFYWNSYCYAPWSFLFTQFAFLGIWMACATVVSIFYCASSEKYLPNVDIYSPEGDCGVGNYISKVKKWTILGSAVLLLPLVAWIRILIDMQGGLSLWYLLTPIIIILLTFFIIIRQIRSVIKLRNNYIIARSSLGTNWQDIANLNIPPDPTLSYIGLDLWKFPTVIYPLLAGLWFLAEILGVAGKILQQVG